VVKVKVPATTANLGPGFDCLGLALSLYNEVEMTPHSSWNLRVIGEGEGSLSTEPDNLVWMSACRLWREAGVQEPVVHITLKNAIPLSRGLGSSSAAIVSGLVAANTFLPTPWTQQELLNLATAIEGHPDNVAPALLGGLVASASDGYIVHAQNLELNSAWAFTVCIPSFTLATSLARQALPSKVSHSDAVFNLGRAVMMTSALRGDDVQLLRFASEDKLHQPYRSKLIPGFHDVCSAALELGAAAVMLSGAGPTVLAVSPHGINQAKLASAMEKAFAEHGISAVAREVKPSLIGAIIQ